MECKCCGKCCVDIYFFKDEYKKFIKGKEFEKEGIRIDGGIYFSKCPLLSNENLCSINVKKPRICRTYPIIGRKNYDNSFCNSRDTLTLKDKMKARFLLFIANIKLSNVDWDLVCIDDYEKYKFLREGIGTIVKNNEFDVNFTVVNINELLLKSRNLRYKYRMILTYTGIIFSYIITILLMISSIKV